MESIVRSNLTTSVKQCAQETVVKGVTEFLSMFYIISPSKTIKHDPYAVPDYEVMVSLNIK